MMSRPVKKSFISKQFIDTFNKRYTNDNKQKLINFLDNIETNKIL